MNPPIQLPSRSTASHKGNFGKVLLVGGSRGMSGSIALSSIAALRTGSGLVTTAVPDRCLESVASFHPGIMTLPLADTQTGRFAMEAREQLAGHLNKFSAIGCGPGMTTDHGSIAIVERLLEATSVPRVLDADAINVLSHLNWPESNFWPESTLTKQENLVLTPHPGEFQRLSGSQPT